MAETEGGDAGIVHLGARHLSSGQQSLEHRPVAGGLVQQQEARRGEQSRDLLECARQFRRGAIDFGVGGDGEELVHAGPGNCPSGRAFDQLAQGLPRPLEPGRIAAVGVDEEVGVDSDQVPLPA